MKNSQHSGFFYSQSIAHETVFMWMYLNFVLVPSANQLNVVEANHKTCQIGCFLLSAHHITTKQFLKCNTCLVICNSKQSLNVFSQTFLYRDPQRYKHQQLRISEKAKLHVQAVQWSSSIVILQNNIPSQPASLTSYIGSRTTQAGQVLARPTVQ